LEQSAGKVGWNFLVNTYRGKPSWAASIMAGGPGAASKSPDGLEQAIGGSNDKVVQAALVPAGG
jgi:hypothetical protein